MDAASISTTDDLGVNVIVPLGGLGTRFQQEGYLTRPKPFVRALGKPMIMWVLENLTLGKNDQLVIVFDPSFMGLGHLMQEIVGERFPLCKFVKLSGPTRGAAETVLIGLTALDDVIRRRPTMLVDGDTFYTTDIVGKFREVATTYNAVFCFNDTQPQPIYSYIRLSDDDDVIEVKEKVKISDWANSGCYCFRSGRQLAAECESLLEAKSTQANQVGIGEFYTSGVIAAMIAQKEPFRALKLDVGDIHVLGTPSQLLAFCQYWPTQPQQRFVFDLEGVLIVGTTGEGIPRNIDLTKRLKREGHTIVVQSTRDVDAFDATCALLGRLGVPYDELRCGKPRGEFYITGPTVVDAVLGSIDKQVGFFPTGAGDAGC
eukprot:TRINITY_DN69825_c0_g1_i1.p1 TRINITY_DN69825_c0_g1~~TRINITY_DN69825_c0_g1_i1.p1  ORF type:complete len:399 (-),score=60.59 TRINITY_DN69825_c0_g1_i1:358-1476(-)